MTELKRPKAHIISEESEVIFKSLLPKEWIVRTISKDYGVDYEVEIVDEEIVTGKRCWIQLKGCSSLKRNVLRIKVPSHYVERMGGKEYINVDYIAFRVSTRLLEYALQCNFPLLLGVVDIVNKDVYWLPLHDEIEVNLERRFPYWASRKSLTLRIPIWNRLSLEKKENYPGLRWYAMEPARMRMIGILGRYYHELQQECRLSGYEIGEGFIDYGEEHELMQSLKISALYLMKTLQIDCLFGEKGVALYKTITKQQMMEGLVACKQLLQDIPERRISFISTSKMIGTVFHAVNLISTCIAIYPEFRRRFLFSENVAIHYILDSQ